MENQMHNTVKPNWKFMHGNLVAAPSNCITVKCCDSLQWFFRQQKKILQNLHYIYRCYVKSYSMTFIKRTLVKGKLEEFCLICSQVPVSVQSDISNSCVIRAKPRLKHLLQSAELITQCIFVSNVFHFY